MGKFKYRDLLTKEFLTRPEIIKMSSAHVGRSLCLSPSVIEDYRRIHGLTSPLAVSGRQAVDIRMSEHLTDWETGILIGTLLGDGNLTLNQQNNARFRVRHCDKQREYVDVLHTVFQRFCSKDVTLTYDNTTGMQYPGFSTVWHPDFTAVYHKLYSNGVKTVTQEVLDLLTVPGLVCWFYDDGGRSKTGYLLSTCSFSLQENQLIRQHLFRRFGIKTTPMRKSNGKKYYWYLYFAAATTPILDKYLSDFYLPCFDYKLRKSVLRPSETTRETSWSYLKMKI
jgi:hypothetical protein